MVPKIIPIVLAGGTGTRLWPISRDTLPKQFLTLIGQRSTYQEALLRTNDTEIFCSPIVVTGSNLHFFAQRQAEEVGIQATIIVEPMRRDSAAAIAAATTIARDRNPDAIVLVLAADHVILDNALFLAATIEGREAAQTGKIVTFGIKPTEPKTSYGYILPGEVLVDNVYAIKTFVEKPDLAKAIECLKEGYLWNSGNFLFRADALLSELVRFEPEIASAIESAVSGAKTDLGFVRLDPEAFASAPQKSIDYAVMERTTRAVVVEGKFRWSDIGSWDALFEIAPADTNGNAIYGDVVAVDTQNSIVHTDSRLIATIGIKDLIVVSTADAVMVVPRTRAQDVKELVGKLKSAKRPETSDHRRVHRPWGYYESIDTGERFQVKRIVVTSGGELSLQKHLHRAEHWVVVRGTAEVTTGTTIRNVHENESIYIPIGTVHRLANRGKIPLQIIEVQTGSYLGEDDIIRLQDIYNRVEPESA